MQFLQNKEKEKLDSIENSAKQYMINVDGYRSLKMKLEGIQQAIKAKHEKGNTDTPLSK